MRVVLIFVAGLLVGLLVCRCLAQGRFAEAAGVAGQWARAVWRESRLAVDRLLEVGQTPPKE